MGGVLGKSKRKKKFSLTVSSVVRSQEGKRHSFFSKNDVHEERKSTGSSKTPILSPEVYQLLDSLDKKETIPKEVLAIYAWNGAAADALLLLNTILPVTSEIVRVLARHGKYAKKIVDALILLSNHNILLTMKIIAAIADTEYYSDRVANVLLTIETQVLLTEDVILGVAAAGFMSGSVAKALVSLNAVNIVLTKEVIDTIVAADDAEILAVALVSLAENAIFLTDEILLNIAQAEYSAPRVANGLIRLKNAGLLLTGERIARLGLAEDAEKEAVLMIEISKKFALQPFFAESLSSRSQQTEVVIGSEEKQFRV